MDLNREQMEFLESNYWEIFGDHLRGIFKEYWDPEKRESLLENKAADEQLLYCAFFEGEKLKDLTIMKALLETMTLNPMELGKEELSQIASVTLSIKEKVGKNM